MNCSFNCQEPQTSSEGLVCLTQPYIYEPKVIWIDMLAPGEFQKHFERAPGLLSRVAR